MSRTLPVMVAAVFLLALTSCEEGDERLARYASESVRQQAEQNREMSQLNREVAQAHQELISLQHDLEERHVEVDHQRDQLEDERRQIAEQRHRDPLIAAAINSIGVILACLAPLALAAYLLYCLRDQDPDQAVGELLIGEFVAEEPALLPSPQRGTAAVQDQRKPGPPSLTQADSEEKDEPTE